VYERLGWVRVGDVPKYALLPLGGLCSTTFHYRDLSRRKRAGIAARSSAPRPRPVTSSSVLVEAFAEQVQVIACCTDRDEA